MSTVEVLLGSGGWPTVGVNDDLAAVLLASEDAAGRVEPAVLTRYRVWPGQEVASAAYAQDKPAAFEVVGALVNARRRRAGRAPVRPAAAGPAHGRVRVVGWAVDGGPAACRCPGRARPGRGVLQLRGVPGCVPAPVGPGAVAGAGDVPA
ncbi:MAG TPA: hypothetical protein VEL73_02070, partial [Mycobacteriales bacterium]|nr:hypothetical protein [Mycobacteriales bacterium]